MALLSTAFFLSLTATATMAYIAMATPIGPWIETTLVLVSMIIFSARRAQSTASYNEAVILATAAGGIGGILATAMAFSLPTLHFVAPHVFTLWLHDGLMFSVRCGSFACAAGSFGMIIADYYERALLDKKGLKFPIGELVYATMSSPGNMVQSIELIVGFIMTQLILSLYAMLSIGAKTMSILSERCIGWFTVPALVLPVSQLPLYLSIGFVTGHIITIPLLMGCALKIFCLDPLYTIYMRYGAYGALSSSEYIFACCSGIVLYGTLLHMLSLPKALQRYVKQFKEYRVNVSSPLGVLFSMQSAKMIIVLAINIACLSAFGFSWTAQGYMLLSAIVWIHQMLIIAGTLGIAPLGRFATFMMVPAMALFNLDMVQVTLTAAFVEIAGGVACDTLFGRKTALLAGLSHAKIMRYQWLGLLVSGIASGIIFWLLIAHFGLGNEGSALPVTKAAGRALLIGFKHFDPYILLFGMIVGWAIQKTPINPAMVLGGILMPPMLSLMLIAGGLLTFLTSKSERYYPLCSGISAGNSLWMLIEAFIGR